MRGYGAGKWNADNQLWWTGASRATSLMWCCGREAGTYEVIVTLPKPLTTASCSCTSMDERP